MTTVSLGGIYSNSHQKACHKRYTAATAGIRIISGESSPKAAVKLCAISEVDTIAWDLVDVEVSDAIRLCIESLFETIVSNNSLTLGSGGESATEDSGQTVISGYFISQCAFSMAFGNRPGNLVAGVEPPIDAWDVLDLERYSGRRKLNRRLIFEMEWAFACDGMSWNWQMFDFDSWVVPVGELHIVSTGLYYNQQDLTDTTTMPPKLDASAWPGVPAVFAGLVGTLPKELA